MNVYIAMDYIGIVHLCYYGSKSTALNKNYNFILCNSLLMKIKFE